MEQEDAKEEEKNKLKEVEHMSPELELQKADVVKTSEEKVSVEIKKAPSIDSTKRLQRLGSDQR